MQINLLKKIVEHTAGIQAVKIVDLLSNKKDVNEFLIAKKLKLTINQTRNLIYRLSHLGIISSIRKKDKRKGWYIYFWTLNVLKSLEVLERMIGQEIEELKNQLADKQLKRFYKCKICGREVNEEAALLTNFTCSECGEVYGLADMSSAIAEIQKNISRLEKDLSSVRAEISEEELEKEKKMRRNLKKDEKNKKALRDKLRKKNKRAKTALLKKSGKKPRDKKSRKKKK